MSDSSSSTSSSSNRVNTRDDAFDDASVAPNGYSLQQLLFVHRHGERTMVMARFPEHPVHFAGECQQTRAFSVVRTNHSGHLQFEERILDSHAAPPRFLAPLDDCALGQLTDRGALTLESLGQSLRRRYVDQARLLPARFDASTLLVQSTDVPRAIASAKFLLSGLYPARTRTVSDAPVLHIRKPDDEIIYPNWSFCPRIRQISEHWKRHSGVAADMDDFKERLPVLFGLEPPPPAAADAQPPVNALAAKPRAANVLMTSRTTHSFFDENAVRMAHDLPLLPGSTPENVAEAAALSTTEWFGQYSDPVISREVCRIGIGPLFRDMLAQITSANPRKAVLYSGHDTTIAPLLACVTGFDNKWPKYGSNVAFEVLQKDDTKEKFVQLRYNFARRVMQECQPFAPKDAPTLCPMAKFEDILKSRIPSDWEQECKKK
jgi:hypothetical protein